MKTNQTDSAVIIRGPGAIPVGDRSMGALLIDAGRINAADAERILHHAKERGLRFGDAAVALKLVTDDDIQQVLAHQFDYPYLRPGQSAVSTDVAAAWRPFSRQVEALRALRSQLLMRWFTGEEHRNALAVVSAASGEGRSYLAANLAVVFSQMGERTLLVDADLRHPKQHELFGLSNTAGLSTILAERSGMDVIHRVPAFVDLSIATAGPTPPNPLELLGRASFGSLMATVSNQYDVVIVDTPAASLASDFQLIAQKVGGALLLARQHMTSADDCRVIADEIAAASAVVIGTVLNQH
jgi:protein-tyrosine kinase